MLFRLASLFLIVFYSISIGQQSYAKLYLQDEGIYKITGQELQNAGIPISQIQPNTLQLFSDGQKVLPYSTADPIPQLNELAIVVEDGGDNQIDPQDYILFYGQSLNRFEWDGNDLAFKYIQNPYDSLACYWLRWNMENGKRIPLKDRSPVSPTAAVVDTFTNFLHLESDHFNPLKSGLTWTWNLFDGYDIFSYSFDLDGLAGSEAHISSRIVNFDYFTSPLPGQITLTLNGVSVGPLNVGNGLLIDATLPVTNANNLLAVEYNPTSPSDTVKQIGFDWIDIRYPRFSHLQGNEMKLFVDENSGIFLFKYNKHLAPDTVGIFDITDPFDVHQIFTSNDSLFENTLSVEHKQYFLYMKGTEKLVMSIEPSFREIFSPADGADYLIITHGQFESEVLPLKSHRETYNNFVVKLIHIEDIVSEFGFGRNDPTAIRNFIKFAHSNWSPIPQFVLLAGNGYYDYRNVSGDYPHNWIPTFQIDGRELWSRVVDDYFVDLDFVSLTNIEPEIPIGRYPANSTSELSTFVQKTIDSEIHFEPGLWRLTSLLIADDEFGGTSGEYFFLKDMEDFARDILPERVRILKLYERDYPFEGNEKPSATRQLINWINHGSKITVFYGHSVDEQWTHENLMNVEMNFSPIKNFGKMSFFMGAHDLYKSDEYRPGILEKLLKKERSGSYAALASGRPTFLGSNESLLRNFWNKIFNEANGVVGTAMIMAKSGSINDQKYMLYGDPALKVILPQERVQVSIAPDTLKAQSVAQVTGQINNSSSNDSLIVELREPGEIKKVSYINYETTGGVLFRGYIPVNNGQFSFQFVVSSDIPHDTIEARGKLYAYTWNGSDEGMGFMDSIMVGGLDSGVVDVTPPQISLSVIESDTVGVNAYLAADLFDENGINLSHYANHFPMLFIDHTHDTINISDFFYYDQGSYQTGKIRYPLPYLENGNHQIRLSVHDNYNNSTSDSIDIVVGVEPPTPIVPEKVSLSQNYPNPFNPETIIPFQIVGTSRYQVKLEIFNILGQRIRSLIGNELPAGEHKVNWDSRNEQGVIVASGLYIYRLKVTGGKKNYQFARKMLLLR